MVAGVFLLSAGVAVASTTDFTGFSLGTVNGQGGWTVEDEWGNGPLQSGKPKAFDEAVTDDGSGNAVWRASNAVTYTEFSFQPFSPTAPEVAGETGANLYNNRGPDNTNPTVPTGEPATTHLFHAGFSFKSTTGASQADLAMSFSPSAKQSSWRMSYLSVEDTGSGFSLVFVDTDALGDFPPTTVATDLSYTDWHRVDLYIRFVDGLNSDGSGNDIVNVVVDGSLVHTGTTWETYYSTYGPFSGISGSQVQAVDSLMFALRGNAAPATDGNGLYFDDVVIDNAPLNPATTDDCKKDGWADYSFRNQGQCIQFVNTGKDSR
jgi:hypothetical protein